MSMDIKQDVDRNSTEFNEGVEAGLNSEEATKNWKAGNALGRALKDEGATEELPYKKPFAEASIPLFLRDYPGSNEGSAHDEKDEMGE